MKIDRGAALSGSALRAAIRSVFMRFLDLDKWEVFLFGSEADGTANPHSDIDVGILGPRPLPGNVMQQIREELDTLRTLRMFDVVDFQRVDASFKSVALQNVERL